MRRILLLTLVMALTLGTGAQTKRSTKSKTATTTTAKKKSATSSKTTSAQKSGKKKTAAKGKKSSKKKSSTANYSTAEIKGLQSQRSKIQGEIRKQEQALRANKADVKKRLQDLMVINSEIDKHQKNIDGIQQDISSLDDHISLLDAQLQTLQGQLNERKAKYLKSMRYVSRRHTVQDKLMFIFSAQNFTQMLRRARFVREYAGYQKAQGEAVKAKQRQVSEKQSQLQTVKGQKNVLLDKGRQEHRALEGKQAEQQTVVASLQKQQKTIQQVIAKQRKEDAALNAKIDKLIAEEVAKAQARAAAEAKRKAEAEAAKRRAAELARKKAEAERIERENAQRIAAARERERQAKAEAEAAARERDNAARERKQQAAREAEAERKAMERKAEAENRRQQKEIAEVKKDVEATGRVSSVDRMMSGGFEANRGRLPMPITGSYRIVSHYGQNSVEGLKGVTLDNKGINILGSAGCRARSIYDGEVSAVFGYGGQMVVMVRHGVYISVYCNLSSVSVSKGQHVSTRQVLGTVSSDNILQFQLRHNMDKLNPESWLSR